MLAIEAAPLRVVEAENIPSFYLQPEIDSSNSSDRDSTNSLNNWCNQAHNASHSLLGLSRSQSFDESILNKGDVDEQLTESETEFRLEEAAIMLNSSLIS